MITQRRRELVGPWSIIELPRLRSLEIELHGGDAWQTIAELADVPLLSQLDALILRNFELRERCRNELVARARDFAHLRRFSLLDVEVDPWERERVEQALPNVEIVDRGEDDW